MIVHRLSAFTKDGKGGNPAGVVLLDAPLAEAKMQTVAAEVGYSETAFLYPHGNIWKIRYFAPEIEVPFCGHATIATGAQLGASFGAGTYRLELANGKEVPVQSEETELGWKAAFRSPPTWSKPMPDNLLTELLNLFGLTKDELDINLPPSIIHAGATHPLLALRTRERLSHLGYAFEQARLIQKREGFATIHVVYAENENLFHARGPFAVGGLYEDPATGAAAAALGGFLRDIAWSDSGSFETIQGEDIGKASHLIARYNNVQGDGVHIEGLVSKIGVPLSVEQEENWCPVFFYGLHMDIEVLQKEGFSVFGSERAILADHAVHLLSKAFLIESQGAKAVGILAFMTANDFARLYENKPDYIKKSVQLIISKNNMPIDAITMIHKTSPVPEIDSDYAAKFMNLISKLGLESI